ncbi:hypothetical protein [Actinomadura kijaniata]|uniref:hypothetical protein n=1 Tax=Actinomadura kijaniata TaxID=46161 RepID=UPI000833CFD0|nr:hypothetical protein [Actinomadura kijaniata]
MRKLLAAAGSLLLTLTLLQGVSRAGSGAAILEVILARTPGENEVRPLVRAASPAGITKVTVGLRLRGEDAPYATAEATELFGGSRTEGQWGTPGTMGLKDGRTVVDVVVTDGAGQSDARREAAYADVPADRFVLGGPVVQAASDGQVGGYVVGPFGGSATITHDRPIKRVEMRLYRAGTNELVGTADDVRPVRQDGGFSVYSSARTLNPPPGNYQLTVTAWNDRDDRQERRSGKLYVRYRARMLDVRQDRDWIDADRREVTVTGRLVGVHPDGSQPPVAGARIYSGGDTDLMTTTDTDGRFSLTVRLDREGTAQVLSTGTGVHAPPSTTVKATVRGVPTAITVRSGSAEHVGDKITVSGQLKRQRATDDAMVPLGGETVALYYNHHGVPSGGPQRDLVAEVTTDADGRYRLDTTIRASGFWEAVYPEPVPGHWYKATSATAPSRSVRQPTVIEGVALGPGPIAQGASLSATGRVSRPKSSGENTAVIGGFVDLQFSTDGKKWVTRASGVSHGQGRFGMQAKVTQDGYWRVRYAGGTSGNASSQTPDDAAVSPAKWIDVRHRTAIRDFNATPEPVRKGGALTLKGNVVRDLGNGWKAAGKGAKVTLYFRAKGSTKWTAVTTTTTDAKGAFRKAVKASRDGTWRAAYAGGSSYLGSTSADDYVDVK